MPNTGEKASAEALETLEGLNFANVVKPYSLAGFNILAVGTGIQAPSEIDGRLRDIPPVINLAIALSLIGCNAGEGIVLWQPKDRRPGKRSSASMSVPDLIFWNLVWDEGQKLAFRQASYEGKREFLNAEGRLQPDHPVLPFSLHFPGPSMVDKEDARVTANIDGVYPPLAAISIPGNAYIGWVPNMIPSTRNAIAFRQHYLRDAMGCDHQFLLSADQKQKTRVRTAAEMFDKIFTDV